MINDGPILHAIAIALPWSKEKRGFIWPATAEDTYNQYSGDIRMGTLIAIDPTAKAEDYNLSGEGVKLFHALQDFGAYHVDSTGQVNSIALYLEPSAADELSSTIIGDLNRIHPLLRCITNNGPGPVGGGGTPRAPFAPPLP